MKLNAHQILTLMQLPRIKRRALQDLVYDSKISATSTEQLFKIAQEKLSPSLTLDLLKAAEREASIIEERCKKQDIHCLVPGDPRFSKSLYDIPNRPVLLFAKGNLKALLSERYIAVVGTRKATAFGKKAAERLGKVFAQNGLTIVSGLALGCDTAAHQGCLSAHGTTIAVLAHGLDLVYPAQNKALAETILKQGGCLISEHPPTVKPKSRFYVQRNRIQSGLSKAVVVIESAIKGGTMHTANFCKDQNRLLACLKPTVALLKASETAGNRYLLKDKDVHEISDRSSLKSLLVKPGMSPSTIKLDAWEPIEKETGYSTRARTDKRKRKQTKINSIFCSDKSDKKSKLSEKKHKRILDGQLKSKIDSPSATSLDKPTTDSNNSFHR